MLTFEPPDRTRGEIALLHGVVASAHTWWQVGPALAARGWRVRAIDHAGHGANPPVGRPLSVELMVDHVARELSGPVDVVVGHSLGAVVALAYAARHPGRTRGLVLEDPVSSVTTPDPNFGGWIDRDTALARTDPEQIARRERWANRTWREEDVRHSVEAMAATDREAVLAGLDGALAWNLPDLISTVEVPALLMLASVRLNGSALDGPDRNRVLALLPADRVVTFDSGHCLHRDRPAQWTDQVDAFACGLSRR